MKNYLLFFSTLCIPLNGVSRAYRGYQKALDAYARERSPENFSAFESAYRALFDSPLSLRGERLAAESEFKRRLNEQRSIELFIEDEVTRAEAVRQRQRDVLEEALAQEKERVALLASERDRMNNELQALKAQIESLEKARTAPEREARYEQLRTSIRSLMDAAPILAPTSPAIIQNRMDRLFDLYAIAEQFAYITQNPADRGLRKKILIPLRNLFESYQGPDGNRGDQAIRNTYRARINTLLTQEKLTTISATIPGEDPYLLD